MMDVAQTKSDQELDHLRREIVAVGRMLGEDGFHAALAGNISARLGKDRIVCTCAGADKRNLDADQLTVCSMQGDVLEGSGRPTSELLMHLSAYRARADVRAVIHAHPPTATAFAAASEPLDNLCLPEMLVWLGPVALAPYATPGTPELSAQLEPLFAGHDAFLLENHGVLTLGKSLRQAGQRMELIEQNARITLMVRLLGKNPYRLQEEQLKALRELGLRLTGKNS